MILFVLVFMMIAPSINCFNCDRDYESIKKKLVNNENFLKLKDQEEKYDFIYGIWKAYVVKDNIKRFLTESWGEENDAKELEKFIKRFNNEMDLMHLKNAINLDDLLSKPNKDKSYSYLFDLGIECQIQNNLCYFKNIFTSQNVSTSENILASHFMDSATKLALSDEFQRKNHQRCLDINNQFWQLREQTQISFQKHKSYFLLNVVNPEFDIQDSLLSSDISSSWLKLRIEELSGDLYLTDNLFVELYVKLAASECQKQENNKQCNIIKIDDYSLNGDYLSCIKSHLELREYLFDVIKKKKNIALDSVKNCCKILSETDRLIFSLEDANYLPALVKK